MTDQTTSLPNTKTPLIKRIGLASYRLLDRMTETAYRNHKDYLHTRYGI